MSNEEKTELEKAMETAQAKADESNKALGKNKGTRTKVGATRGRNPVVISWPAFDESIPESLPTSMEEFMALTGVKDEPTLVSYLISGANDAAYTAASDPLAEFVENVWPPEVQTQFRVVVRNYSRGASVSLEDAVTLIKPGFVKQFGPKV